MKRNELKELMITLHLTKDLEDTLEQRQVKGASLSDKIKSFETLTQKDFEDEEDEGYSYRQYKRNLIGGYYNDLRWVAHERNQMMHKDGYTIAKFSHFQRTILYALEYLNPNYNDAFKTKKKRNFVYTFYEQPLYLMHYFIFNILPFLIPVLFSLLLAYDKIPTYDYTQIGTYILFGIWIFVVIVAGRLIETFFLIIENILSKFFEIFAILFHLLLIYKVTLSLLLLSYLFWDTKLEFLF
jgi:hypothetical protein